MVYSYVVVITDSTADLKNEYYEEIFLLSMGWL